MQKHILGIIETSCEAFKTLITKSASKKFLVFVIATHMTYIALLPPQSWMFIAMLFLGIQGGLDWKNLLTNPAPQIPSQIQSNVTGISREPR